MYVVLRSVSASNSSAFFLFRKLPVVRRNPSKPIRVLQAWMDPQTTAHFRWKDPCRLNTHEQISDPLSIRRLAIQRRTFMIQFRLSASASASASATSLAPDRRTTSLVPHPSSLASIQTRIPPIAYLQSSQPIQSISPTNPSHQTPSSEQAKDLKQQQPTHKGPLLPPRYNAS